MNFLKSITITTTLLGGMSSMAQSNETSETLPPLNGRKPPANYESLWRDFDPEKEPLEVEVLKEWEEDGVVLRVVRYRVGIFKGKKAMVAGIYGFPKGGKKLPGLVQIHGGGQYADYRAPLYNAKRGYATISISWAGRINAPGYKVTPAEVKLFWEGKTDDPHYRLTTDWGALDAYHAPCRNPRNSFARLTPAEWTLDPVPSPRNNPWFLCVLAARRALTFLERQPEVDPARLGVYGHSMGGKITVMTAGCDPRVKVAVPSCGGVSDRTGDALKKATICDHAYLPHITCPILFLNPSNDFHARINDLAKAVKEIRSSQWRVTTSPHHNHQDTPKYMVSGMLWLDQWLKGSFSMPATPELKLNLKTGDGIPEVSVKIDQSRPVKKVDVYYTQQGKTGEKHDDAKTRFWHYAQPVLDKSGTYTAKLPLHDAKHPLWVFTSVTYSLDQPITAVSYYYAPYTAQQFVVSSPIQIAMPRQLAAAGVKKALTHSSVIETFEPGWEKAWFTYNPKDWARKTHKIHDPCWTPPDETAPLLLEVQSEQANTLVVRIDHFAAEVKLRGGRSWQQIRLLPSQFVNSEEKAMEGWKNPYELELAPQVKIKEKHRGGKMTQKQFGDRWKGAAPRFRKLCWGDSKAH
ncbi:MAG: hypothetical protein D6820_01815 [Lentisphaerae bacterium]|nr:MAG: hypothetical protein D6820_01815 [Lentisphaerota bacterium]